jgi:hypothetical protein
METVLPIRRSERRDREDPRLMKSKQDIPNPKRAAPYRDNVLPKRAKPRQLAEDPSERKSNTEIHEPNREVP